MLGIALDDGGLELADLCALVRAIDGAGYTSLWVPETGARDALGLATLYGRETRRISVGTGVLSVYSRNIVSLSIGAATAAEAGGGRFLLGLGTGYPVTTTAWFGQSWKHPRERLRESIDVARRILAGERVHHNGEVRVDGFHLGTSPPHVPVVLGALTPASLRLAGRIADGVLLNWLPPEGVERSALLAREAASDAGRRVRVFTYVPVAVCDDPDNEHAARAAVREHAYSYVRLPVYANALRGCGLSGAVDRVAEGDERALTSLVESLCLCGDTTAVRERLQRFQQSGIDSTVLYPVPYGDTPAESVLHTIRALAPA